MELLDRCEQSASSVIQTMLQEGYPLHFDKIIDEAKSGSENIIFSFLIKAIYERVESGLISHDFFIRLINIITPTLLEAGNFYTVSRIDTLLPPENSYIHRYILENGVRYKGVIDSHLVDYVRENNCDSEDTLNDVLLFEFSDEDQKVPLKVDGLVEKIRLLLQEYCAFFAISVPRYLTHKHINAAMFLQNRYDAYISIMHGGDSVPVLMHALGANVGFVETHDETMMEPLWRMQCELQSKMRVLLCDEDAVSGDSMRRVCTTLQQEASNLCIDALFSGSHLEDSVSSTHGVAEISQINTIHSFSATRVYTHLLAMITHLEQRLNTLKS